MILHRYCVCVPPSTRQGENMENDEFVSLKGCIVGDVACRLTFCEGLETIEDRYVRHSQANAEAMGIKAHGHFWDVDYSLQETLGHFHRS